MKKLLFAAAGLAMVAGLGVLLPPDVSRAQNPSGGKGEAITIPIGQPTPQSTPQTYLPTTPGFEKLPQTTPPWQAQPGAKGTNPDASPEGGAGPKSLREYLNQNYDDVDINQDISVKPEHGAWMICLNWYSGPEAPKMARQMVEELRNNPDYKLRAYVFTKGAEERKAEVQRVAKCIEEQRKRLAELNLPADSLIRVPVARYEIQCAVLVGGYKDMESARKALDQLKKLKPPDPTKVPQHSEIVVQYNPDGTPKEGKYVAVNPFTHGLVVPNPSVAVTHAKGPTPEEVAQMRTLNADESYSLFKCPKKYTLAVKQFYLPASIEMKGSSSMFSKSGFGSSSEKVDAAQVSAHNLADLLHKGKFEAYVLHTKFCSFVTVGSFNDKDDRELQRLQQELPKLNAQLHPSIQLVSRPVIMEVPK